MGHRGRATTVINAAQSSGRRRARPIRGRLIIRGGSAGGYTTLAALTRFHDIFKAGASYYGISDLEALAQRHAQVRVALPRLLVGPYPATRDDVLARARRSTPSTGCRVALILFQGLEDKVVPPNQSEMMAEARAREGAAGGLPGLRRRAARLPRAENIVRSLEAELYFYGAVFGFTPADRIEPVPIDNAEALPTRR